MKLLIVLLLAPLVSFASGYVLPMFEKDFLYSDVKDEQWEGDDEPIYLTPFEMNEGKGDTGRPMGGEHTGLNRILNTFMDTGETTHVTDETGGRRPFWDEKMDIEGFFDKMELLKIVFEEMVRNGGTDNKIIGMWLFLDEIMKLKKEYEDIAPKDDTGRRPTVSDLQRFKDKIKDLKKVYIDNMGNRGHMTSGGATFDLRGFFDKMKDLKKAYEDKIRNEEAMGVRPVNAVKSDLQTFFDKMMELKNVYEAMGRKDIMDI